MQNRASLAALNAIIEVTSQTRGISIDLDARERWCVTLALTRGEAQRYAVATQLHHALCALEYLDDGEQVLLDEGGVVLCGTCEGDGDPSCPECEGNMPLLPPRWPRHGLRDAILGRYP